MHLCDAGAINAYILQNGNATRRDFLHELAGQLMRTHQERRSENKYWMNETFSEIAEKYDT